MACRCNERQEALRQAMTALKRGDVRSAGGHVAGAGASLVEDARSGALAREAAQRAARLAISLRRR
jgi:hypothetical protein